MSRNILKERKQSKYLAPLTIIFALFAITTMYYFVAMFFSKSQGGLNVYISGILAGVSGGLWGLGINIGYKLFRWAKYCPDEEWKKRWNTEKSFRTYLHHLIAMIFIFFVFTIILTIIIDITKLY